MSAKMFTVGGKVATLFGKTKALSSDTDNPLRLPPNTIRAAYVADYTPQAGDTQTYVSADDIGNKVWDIYKADNNWSNLFGGKTDAHYVADYMSISGVLAANTTNVTDMSYMFSNCMAITSMPMIDMSNVSSTSWMFYMCGLYSVPKFNTRNVVDMSYMFSHCGHLSAIPLFDTSNALNMDHTFFWTYDVQSGALAM